MSLPAWFALRAADVAARLEALEQLLLRRRLVDAARDRRLLTWPTSGTVH